jgi:tetratricopeptide (TPR) repeat protein
MNVTTRTDPIDTLSRASRLLKDGRLRSALAQYEKILESRPGNAIVLYQLGAIRYCHLGDGVGAREYFSDAAAAAITFSEPEMRQARAYALENLMLLSLSYEEFEKHAGELTKLDPTNDILRNLLPEVKKVRDSGQPWGFALANFAVMHRDPRKPSGVERSSECAATWHLLHAHRGELELEPVEARRVLLGYAAALVSHAGHCGAAMLKAGWDDPGEFMFMLEPARAAVKAYLADDPDDADVRKLANVIDQALAMRPQKPPPQHGVIPERPGAPGTPSSSGAPRREAAAPAPAARVPAQFWSSLGWVILIAPAALGAAAGSRWITTVRRPWNMVVGGAIGLCLVLCVIVFLVARQVARERR